MGQIKWGLVYGDGKMLPPPFLSECCIGRAEIAPLWVRGAGAVGALTSESCVRDSHWRAYMTIRQLLGMWPSRDAVLHE